MRKRLNLAKHVRGKQEKGGAGCNWLFDVRERKVSNVCGGGGGRRADSELMTCVYPYDFAADAPNSGGRSPGESRLPATPLPPGGGGGGSDNEWRMRVSPGMNTRATN